MSEELSLIELARRFKGIASQNFRYAFLVFMISFLTTSAIVMLLPNQYQYELTAQSKSLQVEALNEIVSSLHFLAKEKNYEELSNQLEIDIDEAALLSKIKLIEIFPEVLSENTNRGNYFRLVSTFKTQIDHRKMEQKILDFFERNQYLSTRKELYTEADRKSLAKIEKEIAELEMMRNIVSKEINLGASKIVINPAEINSTIIELSTKKHYLEVGIQLNNQINLVQGFTQLIRPSFPRWTHALLAGLISGVFISFFSILFREEASS